MKDQRVSLNGLMRASDDRQSKKNHFLTSNMASRSKPRQKSAIIAYLGPSSSLPVSDLTTLRDVLKQCQLLRELNPNSDRNFTVHDMAITKNTLSRTKL